jgi:hypothetical protein
MLRAEGFDPDKCDFIEKHLSRKECGTCGKAIMADSERVWVCMCDLNRPDSWPPTETTEDAKGSLSNFGKWITNDEFKALKVIGLRYITNWKIVADELQRRGIASFDMDDWANDKACFEANLASIEEANAKNEEPREAPYEWH